MFLDLRVGNLSEPLTGRRWDGADVMQQVLRRADWYQRHGLQRGDRVGVARIDLQRARVGLDRQLLLPFGRVCLAEAVVGIRGLRERLDVELEDGDGVVGAVTLARVSTAAAETAMIVAPRTFIAPPPGVTSMAARFADDTDPRRAT